jgi:hypothetical protein
MLEMLNLKLIRMNVVQHNKIARDEHALIFLVLFASGKLPQNLPVTDNCVLYSR